MNTSRSTKPPSASPSTGIRHRLGQVVRWHAEPVISEEYPAAANQAAEGPRPARAGPADVMRGLLLTLGMWGMASGGATALTVEIQHTLGGEPLRFEKRQALDVERDLAVTRLDYFITEFALLTPEGRALRADGQAAFVSVGQGRTTFEMPGAPPGRYAGVAFRVGVPTAQSARDPAAWPAGHALNPAVNGLHWGWQGGYVFLALEGRMNRAGFSYHLARGENLMTARIEQPLQIAEDSTVVLRLDVARVLHAIEVMPRDGSESTHSAPGDPLAAQLKANVQAAWSLGEVKATASRRPVFMAKAALPAGTTAFAFAILHGFPAPELPADNPLTVEGIALGERLFHERQLSVNSVQSCASCHDPARGFAQPRATSLGAEGVAGSRNAPGLVNLAWGNRYAWDGRRPTLRAAAVAPISDAREMALPLEQAVSRLASDGAYRAQFAKAFGAPETDAVTAARVGLALEQFLLTRLASSSKFDRVLLGKAQLTEEEALGFALFHTEFDPARGQRGADCFHCHGGFDFSDHGFHDIGLVTDDPGLMATTGREEDRGKFKTPTLRNVAQTAPYFHDGRIDSLGRAVAHYDRGVRHTRNLDPNLAKRAALHLTPREHRALVMFLRTLTEERGE